MKAILADTGPLYATIDPDDQYHLHSQAELERLNRESFAVIVPYPIYLETHKLILYRLGFVTAVSFAEKLAENANLINPLPNDYQAAMKLIVRFSDQQITLFDAVTAVLAMQMNLPIWTYDRHFDIIRAQVWR